MIRSGGSHGGTADDGGDLDLEVIDLEPAEPSHTELPRRNPAAATVVHRRRVPVVIAIVLVTALVGSAIVDQSRRSRRTGASTSTTLAGRSNVTQLFPFRVGAQILTAGANGLRLVDTDTGRVTVPRIAGLPPGPVTIVAHSGGTVAVRTGAHLYWFSMPRGVAHPADGDTAFPAARRGHLWLARGRSATEVPGAPNVVATRGPAIGATSAGLLVTTKAGVLLQPTSGNGRAPVLMLRTPGVVVAVHPDRVAWVANDCGVLRCPVHITEAGTGATSTWLQLFGHPGSLAAEGSSGVFSPDGNHLAIVVPTENVSRAATLVFADLRSRVTNIIDVNGRIDEPARPGSADAAGMTLDWTSDGSHLVLAPPTATGAGRIGVVDGQHARVVPSGASLDVGTSAAAIGVSTAGPLDLPRRGNFRTIAPGGPTPFDLPGLSLVGADDQQVDLLDLGSNRVRTWPVGGVVPNPAGPKTVARVTGGWLVVRGGVVDLLTDAIGPARAGLLDAGSLVFSANRGRDAWIAVARNFEQWSVEPYDAVTGTIRAATSVVGTPVGTVDRGLLVIPDTSIAGTALDLVDRSGRLHHGPVIDSPTIEVVATGGTTVAYFDYDGFHIFDVDTALDRLITNRPVLAAALSPDGRNLAWIDDDGGSATTGQVRAMRVDGSTIEWLGGTAERVLVADDGTVLFTSGVDVWRGHVDTTGSSAVYGLAPDPLATLAVG